MSPGAAATDLRSSDDSGQPGGLSSEKAAQWMLDLALNLRGRVQNLERDEPEIPRRTHNNQMLPRMWGEAIERHEALAGAAVRGFLATASAGEQPAPRR